MHQADTAAAEYDWPTCTACSRDLRYDELGRMACRLCQRRTDEHLAALAGEHGLYAALHGALAPGRATMDGRVSGSRTAPLPLRLEPLNLSARGGVVTILQTWLIDWHEALGWRHPRWEGDLQQQCDQAVKALRNNLEWAATEHPAFSEFGAEVSALTRACRRQVTGEPPERRIAVLCACGATLRVTISTPGARCSCGAQYGRTEVLELPLALRNAA
ncbi:hypothetical protein [Streptomyces sp. SAJ15]|uniref:hypothetical protein n=1 Tax=Streptomyces sp. SAJ15 TaxID=2011095 RepID=UPI001184B11A|nr:hypothetical protein [Streptomyces sp. SAJ15]TVL89764.1 hypothetical protein CD790_25545 [Streptomyces sp. SAJ15]